MRSIHYYHTVVYIVYMEDHDTYMQLTLTFNLTLECEVIMKVTTD